MNIKLIGSAIVLLSTLQSSAHAEVPLFHFTLVIEGVSNPQLSVGHKNRPLAATGHQTFKVPAGKSDYLFKVAYQHEGQQREAICDIVGAPSKVIATIDPTKTGRRACKTEEWRQGSA
jgi:hypothetical protein